MPQRSSYVLRMPNLQRTSIVIFLQVRRLLFGYLSFVFEIRFIAEDDDDRFLLKRINEIMEVLYFLEAFPIGY